ncbi:MAG: PepSY domain-containing protein [Clostridiales bacterium]|nr:PepSY domain-containing protein [Clostridiales bacterium]
MNKNIQKNLSDAVRQMIPDDMYERISQNIVPDTERIMNMNTPVTVKKSPMKWIGIAVAACLLIVFGTLGGFYYSGNMMVDSIVDIDVNPSIEIFTNKKDKVLYVSAVNEDADKIIDGMNLKNVDLKVAVNAIIGSMVQNGYLIDDQNGILVSVQNDDTQKASKIRNLVISDIQNSLVNNNVTASVINQTLTDIEKAKAFAAENNISIGKAVFVCNLAAKEPSLDASALAKMSLKEIAALVVEKNIDIRDIVDYDSDDSIWENISDEVEDINDEDDDRSDNHSNNSDAVITMAQAKEIALKDAGVSASDVSFTEVKSDTYNGQKIYEIEFVYQNTEYDYEIHAITGKIISSEKESKKDSDGQIASKNQNTSTDAFISASKAKEIALKHAGISAAAFIKAELDCDDDDDIPKYEIEFYSDATEYDYEINAKTGEILHYESETDD